MIDGQNVIWDVFHNSDLDKAVDKAHSNLPSLNGSEPFRQFAQESR